MTLLIEVTAQRDEALVQLRETRVLLYRAQEALRRHRSQLLIAPVVATGESALRHQLARARATIRCYEERLAAAEGRPVQALPPDLYDDLLATEVSR